MSRKLNQTMGMVPLEKLEPGDWFTPAAAAARMADPDEEFLDYKVNGGGLEPALQIWVLYEKFEETCGVIELAHYADMMVHNDTRLVRFWKGDYLVIRINKPRVLALRP